MKASLNWIKEFVSVSATPQEIADRLSLAGLEVEGLKEQGKGLEKVITATLLKVDKHPNADRLTLCEVRTGEQIHQVVCGAKNHKVGDRVALALPGAKLPNGMEIQNSVIRKVASAGMLCSEKELGFAAESEGILILGQEIPENLPLAEALGLDDTILEVNVTPNRGDCLSIRGLAREVAAAFQTELLAPPATVAKAGNFKTAVEVKLEAADLCPRYTCQILRGVKVAPSSPKIQRRLEACGIRPINNVVDATNYVMLETGQPLHAFDLKEIRGGQVQIRKAKAGEKLKTLDEKDRSLAEGDLVIADAEQVLALAGVMGGQGSGVGDSTVDLLLESAYFSPTAVRKAAKREALQTESSYRFERGIDPNGCLSALSRLAALIVESAGGEAASDAIDRYPQAIPPAEVLLRQKTIRRLIGVEVPIAELLPALSRIGLEGKAEGEDYRFKVSTARSDLTREVDLVEEVARLYGYNRIPTVFPTLSLDQLPPAREHPLDVLRTHLKDWGFTEIVNYSFTSPTWLKHFGYPTSPEVALLNPISEEMSVLRPSLIPQMAQTLQQNVFKGNADLRLFEIRPVYLPAPESNPPFREQWRLCIGLSGNRLPLHFLHEDEGVSLLDLKDYLKLLAATNGEGVLEEKPGISLNFHPKRRLAIDWRRGDGKVYALGELGELHPALLAELGLKGSLALAEISLDLFLTESKIPVKFQQVSPFPSIWRDLNLIVDESVTHGSLAALIRANGGPWMRQAIFFDLYRGKPLEEGKKAMTFRIEYGSQDRTLTDDEVNQAREQLTAKLKEISGAELR